MSEKDKRVEAYLGHSIPDRPETCYDSYGLIEIFMYASRGRQFISGMSGVDPRPLTVGNISEVLAVHDAPLERDTLDQLLFELDTIYLDDYADKRESAAKKPAN